MALNIFTSVAVANVMSWSFASDFVGCLATRRSVARWTGVHMPFRRPLSVSRCVDGRLVFVHIFSPCQIQSVGLVIMLTEHWQWYCCEVYARLTLEN